MTGFINIKVDKKIKSLHTSKRKHPDLIIGNEYFISFGSNIAHPCTLLEIDQNNRMVVVEIKTKSKKPNGGNKIYFDEIGETPEQSILNTVTN